MCRHHSGPAFRSSRRLSGLALVVHAAFLVQVALAGTAAAQSAAPREFYAGKTLTIIVGLAAGGTVDTFVRAFSVPLKKLTPGNPNIIVQNMPGAGGLLSTNYLMEKAPRDGLTITYQEWDPLAQALGDPSLRARYDQFEYVGGTSDTRVDYVRVDSIPGGIRVATDIMKAHGIAIGALNNTDFSGLLSKMSMDVLGVKSKFVTGYRGGNDIFLAMQRGEVQMHNTSIGSFRTRAGAFIKSGTGTGIAYLNTIDEAGKVETNPLITEMPPFTELYTQVNGKLPSGPQWDALNWMVQQFGGVSYVGLAPPGSPPEALAALRKGFELAGADPDFIAQSIKINGLPYQFVGVDKARAIFKALAGVSPAVLETVRRSIAENGK